MSLISKTVPLCNNLRELTRSFVRCYGKVGILGIPFDKGQQRQGVGLGPQALRTLGLEDEITALGLQVKDFGDILYDTPTTETKQPSGNIKKLSDVAACHHKTSQKVSEILSAGYQCLCMGGDHSLSIGTIDGHIKAHRDVSVLWVDAHADLNTAATSASGNVHGMPVALLAKELADYWPYLPGLDWLVPNLSIRNLAYIGLRDVDPYERLLLEKFNITAYGMDDVEQFGIHDCIRLALRRIDPDRKRSLHVSFDIDSLDPAEAPCTGTPVRGGLTLREGIQIIEDVHRTGRLNCIDLAEVNPSLGSEKDVQHTLYAAKHLIQAAFGLSRRGLSLPDNQEVPIPSPEEMSNLIQKSKKS